MTGHYTVLVGTIGNGMYRSTDGGQSFDWLNHPKNGISCNEVVVRGFACDPFDAAHVIAATGVFETVSPLLGVAHGLHESFDGGQNWNPIEGSRGIECWRVTFDPQTQGRYFVGTRPAAIHRTEDGGKSFVKLPVDLPETCIGIGLPRITSIALQPGNPDTIFVSVEIGGGRLSTDGGDSWIEVFSNTEVPLYKDGRYGAQAQVDCHFCGFLPGEPEKLLMVSADGPFVSDDMGQTWQQYPLPRVYPMQFHHDFVLRRNDPDTMLFGVGDDVTGVHGSVLRSADSGATWQTATMPVELNSPVWCFGQHPSAPDRIVVATHMGQILASEDCGASWTKFSQEFGEVRAICWLPNQNQSPARP